MSCKEVVTFRRDTVAPMTLLSRESAHLRPNRVARPVKPRVPLGIVDTVIPHGIIQPMPMTLRLSPAETEALRETARREHRSMQEVAREAIAALHEKEHDGRNLTVNEARPREERPAGGGYGGRSYSNR
jgi:hypothetical protein